jgi:hypothetical protein
MPVKVQLEARVRRALIAQNGRGLEPVPNCPGSYKIVNAGGAGRGGAGGPKGKNLQPVMLDMKVAMHVPVGDVEIPP